MGEGNSSKAVKIWESDYERLDEIKAPGQSFPGIIKEVTDAYINEEDTE